VQTLILLFYYTLMEYDSKVIKLVVTQLSFITCAFIKHFISYFLRHQNNPHVYPRTIKLGMIRIFKTASASCSSSTLPFQLVEFCFWSSTENTFTIASAMDNWNNYRVIICILYTVCTLYINKIKSLHKIYYSSIISLAVQHYIPKYSFLTSFHFDPQVKSSLTLIIEL
jgi:hypothetical protein